MKFTNKDVDIMIVGVNSASLLLATQLVKYGIRPTIVDPRKGLSNSSTTVTLDRISLDVLSRLGFENALLESGSECEGLTIQFGDHILKRFDFSQNLNLSAQSSFLNIEQVKIDKILLAYLGSQVCPVYWNSTITEVKQNENGVKIAIQQDEQSYEIKAKWAVFAESLNAALAKNLNLDQKNWSFSRPLYLSEILPDEQVNKDQHLVLMNAGFMVAEPRARINRYKLVSTTKSEEAVDAVASASISLTYMHQRCIFLGKINFECFSLVRSSVNVHFQDACNLSWKLALTILGKVDKSVLASYELERKPIATRLFNRNYWLFKALFYTGRVFANLRQFLILKSIDKLLHHEDSYRRSGLSLHHSLSANITAGDRLPNLNIYDEKQGMETNLHEWIGKSGFVLLLIGNLSSHLRFNIGQWVKQKYAAYMHVYYLPFSTKNKHVFQAFEVNPEQHRMILIRPDGYIAFINDVLNAALVDTYMEELLKWKY